MKLYIAGIVSLISIVLVACGEYTPKPIGYNRIDIAKDSVRRYDFAEFSFECPESVHIDILNTKTEEGFWFNIVYPQYHATVYCTYLSITRQSFPKAMEDSHHLAYSHVLKADAINEHPFRYPQRGVSGILYEIEGEVATPAQFFATDSARHFLRGSFYYSDRVDPDSVAPVTEYIVETIQHMMNSLEWK